MKKVLGILLIIIGSFLSLASLFGNVPNILKTFANSSGDAETTGAIVGAIVAFLISMALAIFLILFGAKLAKSPKQKRIDPTENY